MTKSSAIALAQLRKKYVDLISRTRVSEETIHQFLVDYPVFVPIWDPYQNTLFSKLSLGSQDCTDFAHIREDTPGARWHFIEIEKPQDRLFTKGGNPSAALTHAMRQLQDWKTWYLEERDYISRQFPYGDLMRKLGLCSNPELRLVMGRRATIGGDERKLMDRLRDTGIWIMTFDRLVDSLSFPICNREKPLRTCAFRNGKIVNLAELEINVSYRLSTKRAKAGGE
jgi:hypothetical protein